MCHRGSSGRFFGNKQRLVLDVGRAGGGPLPVRRVQARGSSGGFTALFSPHAPPAESPDGTGEQKDSSPPGPPAAPHTPPSTPVKLEAGELWGGAAQCERVHGPLWTGVHGLGEDALCVLVEGEQLGGSS